MATELNRILKRRPELHHLESSITFRFHFAPVRMAIKKSKASMNTGKAYSLLMTVWTSAVTMEITVEHCQKS